MMQHYHTPSNLSRKLDISLKYQQLQVGTNKNPLTLNYIKWGHLATLSWTKILWRLLKYHAVDLSQMELIMERVSSAAAMHLSVLFLLDITTADRKYLEHLAMIPCENGTKSIYKFPREVPTQADWKRWQRFWVDYTNRQQATCGARKMDKPYP
jgi:hypothetical protein